MKYKHNSKSLPCRATKKSRFVEHRDGKLVRGTYCKTCGFVFVR